MKKLYVDPQISYVFMDNDVITASRLYEDEWENGELITRGATLSMT